MSAGRVDEIVRDSDSPNFELRESLARASFSCTSRQNGIDQDLLEMSALPSHRQQRDRRQPLCRLGPRPPGRPRSQGPSPRENIYKLSVSESCHRTDDALVLGGDPVPHDITYGLFSNQKELELVATAVDVEAFR